MCIDGRSWRCELDVDWRAVTGSGKLPGLEIGGADVSARSSRSSAPALLSVRSVFCGLVPVELTPGFEPGTLAVNAPYGLAQSEAARPRDGDAIAVSGYPLSEPTLVTTSGCVASAWGTDIHEVQPSGVPSRRPHGALCRNRAAVAGLYRKSTLLSPSKPPAF
jgi:hypothetical protein